jgi:lipopolysaccharide transport system permease protein
MLWFGRKKLATNPDVPEGAEPEIIIKAKSGWQFINIAEILEYRDLFYFLVTRDIKVRYAQSVLGVGWAVLQPVASMIVFTVVFGKLARISSEGVPYAIFSFSALVPWTYFSSALTESTASLIMAQNMLTKIYFPRLIIPLTPVCSRLVDFVVSLALVFLLMVWFKLAPTVWVVTLPLMVLLMMFTASGLGMWLTALSVQYRDVKYGISFVVRLLMYAAPVVYPLSLIPEKYRMIYGLNPMAGVIEGFRTALLGTRPMPWDLLLEASIVSFLIFVGGAFYFRRLERHFADVA